jgi:hypothetical protein
LIIESMLPAVTPKNRLGLPSLRKSAAEFQSGWLMMPTRKALRFEQAADQRHAEARMVDIGVAGDQDDVAGIPAQRSISARDMGRKGAGPKRCAQNLR